MSNTRNPLYRYNTIYLVYRFRSHSSRRRIVFFFFSGVVQSTHVVLEPEDFLRSFPSFFSCLKRSSFPYTFPRFVARSQGIQARCSRITCGLKETETVRLDKLRQRTAVITCMRVFAVDRTIATN